MLGAGNARGRIDPKLGQSLRAWEAQPSCDVKLQVLVYDILPSTTAVFSYVIGSRKLSASVQFFVVVFFGLCSNSTKFVTNNADYIRRLFYN